MSNLFSLERQMYLWLEITQVVVEAERVAGVSVLEVKDAGPRDEINVYVSLEVNDKGIIVLDNPTRAGLLGQSSLFIYSMNDCYISEDYTDYVSPEIRGIEDIVHNYDMVYQQIISQTGGCLVLTP